ncbi:hypothetical protein Tco_0889017 [Tanacetum coccineum]
MHRIGNTMPLVHAILKLVEKVIPKKAPAVLVIRQGHIQKPKHQARGKRKSKLAYDPRHKILLPTKKKHPTKDAECHHCHMLKHWRRNYPPYLTELKKNKASTSSTSRIFTIELYSFPKTNSWIYDIGCGTHICNIILGLRGIHNVNKGALDLYVGNRNYATVESIGSFDLILPSGMVFVLVNCHLSPSITRGVISLSHLWDNDFLYKFTDYGAILVSKDNLFYFCVISCDGIFETDMHNHVSNECSIYTCRNKKSKRNLDSTFLWHCRLDHINKKRITKMQHDGLLKSTDDESFDAKRLMNYLDSYIINCANVDTVRLRWGSKSSWGECSTAKSRITCDNTNGNTMLSEAQGVSLQITFDVRVRTVYHDLYHGRKALVERENMGFDLTKSDICPSFVKDLTAKGVGLRVVDSHTGNHREDSFMPLETIRRYPTSVYVFLDPILFIAGLKPSYEYGQQCPIIIIDGKEMAFRNFMYTETDDDISFLPKEPSLGFGTGSPFVSINTEPPVGSSSSRVTRANTTSSKDSSPLLTISNDDEGLPNVLELQNTNTYHLKAVVDNVVNRRSRELLKVIEQIRGKCDVIKERERAIDEECEGLKAKCKAVMIDFDNNSAVVILHEKISTLSSEAKEHKANLDRMMLEIDDAKHDRMEVVSKVVPSITMELVHSDKLCRLVGKLISFAVFYGRCATFEEVAKLKDPFYLMKVKGYRPSYKKEHTKAGNDLATATFPFLSKVVADSSASIKALLSKNPPTLQCLTPSRTQALVPPSQKATPSSTPVSKPMSPPTTVSSAKP